MALRSTLADVFHLSPLLLALGVATGLIRLWYLSRAGKILWVYLLFGLIVDVAGRMMDYFLNYNLILIPVFGLGELLILYWFYRAYLFTHEPAWLKYCIGVMMVMIIVDIGHAATLPAKEFQSYGRVIDELGVMMLCFLVIRQSIQDTSKWARHKLFLNGVILLYVSSALLIFLSLNFLINVRSEYDTRIYFWLFHFLVTIALYITFIVELWRSGSSRKHLLSGWR